MPINYLNLDFALKNVNEKFCLNWSRRLVTLFLLSRVRGYCLLIHRVCFFRYFNRWITLSLCRKVSPAATSNPGTEFCLRLDSQLCAVREGAGITPVLVDSGEWEHAILRFVKAPKTSSESQGKCIFQYWKEIYSKRCFYKQKYPNESCIFVFPTHFLSLCIFLL